MKTLLILTSFLFALQQVLALSPPMEVYGVSSTTGYRVKPMGGGEESLHRGVDLVGPAGCAVLAAAPGIVVEHWPAPGTPRAAGGVFRGHPVFGGYIIIDHGNGIITLYGHLSQTYVHTGQRVVTGQVLGRQGATGQATGEHLHFEVIINPLLFFGQPLEPLSILEDRRIHGTAK